MASPAPGRAHRVTLVNQFFPPDLSPTAHLTASLAEHLAARGHEVTVVTGGEGYLGEGCVGEGCAGGSTVAEHPAGVPPVDAPVDRGGPRPGGVRVIRLWTPALGKGSITKRLSDYVSFLVGATWRLVRLPRQDVVISLTTPPFVVVAAVAHKLIRRRARVVLWSMDCYPDVIERLGSRTEVPDPSTAAPSSTRTSSLGPLAGLRRLLRPLVSLRRGGPLSRLLRGVNRWAFRRLDHVVALDSAMRDLLVDGYGSPDGLHPPATVIPNWEALDDFPAPTASPGPAPWDGYADPDLVDRFVVLYLGNLGFGHRIDTVVDAAATIGPAEQVAWLFVGGGARWDQLVALAGAADGEPHIVRRPYVPKEQTPAVMAGAGCALIVLADEALGVMSPSKLHANLAAGLPIVYVGPTGSNVDAAIERFGCGVSLRTDDADGLVTAVRRLRDDAGWHDQLAVAARRAFEEAYCDRATLPQWDAIVDPTPFNR